jgi:hypothetical protein
MLESYIEGFRPACRLFVVFLVSETNYSFFEFYSATTNTLRLRQQIAMKRPSPSVRQSTAWDSGTQRRVFRQSAEILLELKWRRIRSREMHSTKARSVRQRQATSAQLLVRWLLSENAPLTARENTLSSSSASPTLFAESPREPRLEPSRSPSPPSLVACNAPDNTT